MHRLWAAYCEMLCALLPILAIMAWTFTCIWGVGFCGVSPVSAFIVFVWIFGLVAISVAADH